MRRSLNRKNQAVMGQTRIIVGEETTRSIILGEEVKAQESSPPSVLSYKGGVK